jgi:copper chaperone NosL
MIISDTSYAAQIRDRQGHAQIFDDIGCMLAKSEASTEIAGVFVRSADGTQWIRGDRAYVVRAKSIASPMGYGLLAFAARSEADEAARARGDAVVIELRSLLGEPLPSPAVQSESGLTRLPVKGDVPE